MPPDIINIHEARTHLSKLVDKAAKGEPFVIAKAGKPLVKVTSSMRRFPVRCGASASWLAKSSCRTISTPWAATKSSTSSAAALEAAARYSSPALGRGGVRPPSRRCPPVAQRPPQRAPLQFRQPLGNCHEIGTRPHGFSRQCPRLLRRGLLDNGYTELPVTSQHAVAIDALPPVHQDPFDRLLIAQSMIEGITLLTTDPVQTL
jgi:prevent-host-death family protein